MYSILYYVFNFEDKIVVIIINMLVLFLILNNHTENWKNPYLLICTPVYFVLQFISFIIYKKNTEVS
ncbi:hypothetical protein B0A66_00465 [Flavobacterium hercynium]|uniref:Uncharacterized protein n=1 Tax=Flavobacterium hercynium TaxID=387094 RepID=A0A226HQA8_9FLAO|nr:hypothetical protein B0A66_00465 [Flavobacterium hercynium]